MFDHIPEKFCMFLAVVFNRVGHVVVLTFFTCYCRFSAKIVEVDDDEMDVLIHFDGWNSRFDEWIGYKSDRLRPAVRTSRKDGSPEKVISVRSMPESVLITA